MKVYQTILIAAGLISKESVEGHGATAWDLMQTEVTDKDRCTLTTPRARELVQSAIKECYGR